MGTTNRSLGLVSADQETSLLSVWFLTLSQGQLFSSELIWWQKVAISYSNKSWGWDSRPTPSLSSQQAAALTPTPSTPAPIELVKLLFGGMKQKSFENAKEGMVEPQNPP